MRTGQHQRKHRRRYNSRSGTFKAGRGVSISESRWRHSSPKMKEFLRTVEDPHGLLKGAAHPERPGRGLGVITEKPMTFERKAIIGRARGGELLRISIAVHYHSEPRQTVDHKVIRGYNSLSISGDGFLPGRRDIEYGGQIYDYLSGMKSYNAPWTAAKVKRLVTIWKRWHLNDLKPGCVHQKITDKNKYWDTAEWARQTARCPYGYNYGTKWLVERLPVGIINELKRM